MRLQPGRSPRISSQPRRSERRRLAGCALASVCALAVSTGPATSLGSVPEAPSNDNYYFPVNLNVRGQPLTRLKTLRSQIDTTSAGLQPNLLSPCGKPASMCPEGPPEPSSCQGVNYGKTVWYDFYPDHDGQVEIQTSGLPNVIRLYRFDPTTLALRPVWCAPGSKLAASNVLEDSVSAGDAYTFQIGGRNGVGGKLNVLFNYGYRDLPVAPFLVQPSYLFNSGQPNRTRLVKLRLIGFAHGETVAYACANCGGGPFKLGRLHGTTIVMSSRRQPVLTSQTRMLIIATAPAQIGRYKLYGYNPHSLRLPVLSTGCLAPQQTTVTPADANHLSLLRQTACPAPAVNPIGAEYVFWTNRYGRLWEARYTGRNWSAPQRLTVGQPGSAPAVAVHANGEQDVFWRGRNGELWEAWYRAGWHRGVDFGSGKLASPPTAGVDAAGNEYVFWEGEGGGLWGKVFRGGAWTTSFEVHLAGDIGSAPAVAVHPGGEVDVFWRSVSGQLEEVWCSDRCGSGGRWNGPWVDAVSGKLGSAPTVAADPAGNEYVFWEGTDHLLYGQSYVAGAWDRAAPVTGGQLGSPPTVAVHADGQEDVFWRGRDGHLWETWGTAGQWAGPRSLPARLSAQPVAGLDASGKNAGSP